MLLAPLALAACATQPRIARTPDGKPDLNGIWEAMGSAHWNIEPHNAQAGPIAQLGALGAIPGGLGVVEGGRIPYTAEAAAKRAENKANWLERDPLAKCYMPGVPRATYLPHPFQITQERGIVVAGVRVRRRDTHRLHESARACPRRSIRGWATTSVAGKATRW